MSVATLFLAVGLALCVAEVFTLTFVLLSFGVAALVAAAVAAAVPGWDAPLVAFVLASLVCLFLLRPFAVRRMARRAGEAQATNAEALFGQAATVTVAIPAGGRGRVRVGGEDWAASADEAIEPGARVRVEGVSGVTLKVRREGGGA